MRRARFANSVTACVSLSLLSACSTTDYAAPIGKFTASMTTANASMKTYFTSMNDFERQVYLQEVLYDQTRTVDIILGGKKTALTPVFSDKSIQARLDALTLLTAYGQKLGELAGSDASTRFAAGSKTLSDNLSGLANTFAGLAGSDDKTAANYIGPIGAIVGVIGSQIINRKRDEALKRAITEGQPAVKTILDQLEKDLGQVIAPLQTTGYLEELAAARLYYNNNRTTLSFGDRLQLIRNIDDLTGRYQATLATDPAAPIKGIRAANEALFKYAQSSHKPTDLAELAGAIDAFVAIVQPFADAVAALRKGN
jgi:hypothetical protein